MIAKLALVLAFPVVIVCMVGSFHALVWRSRSRGHALGFSVVIFVFAMIGAGIIEWLRGPR